MAQGDRKSTTRRRGYVASDDNNGDDNDSAATTTNLAANGLSPDESNSQPTSGTSTPTSSTEDDSLYPRRIILERGKPHDRSHRPSLKGHHFPSYTVRAPNTPFDELDLSQVPFLQHEVEEGPKGWTGYRRVFFIVGTLLGAAVAWFAAQNTGMDGHLTHFRGLLDEQLLSLGVDFSSLDFKWRMPKEFADLGENLFSGPKEWLATKDFRVGRTLAEQGYTAQHPVVLMPGIISTGLESWTTDESVSGYFRKRLWGTTTMMRTVVLDKDLWIRHLSLDPETGLDPPGIKVRAAEGMDAASYFVSGYWIWSKIIENLAAIGYDPNTLYMASYDWRLSYGNLEVRDKFFTRLKLRIEQNLVLTGRKTVLVSHSMGSSVALYFMKWVEASGPGFGNGGDQWVETHVEAFTSVAGTWLGVPKAMAALLSGEMRDTVEVPPAAAFLLEKFFSRKERAALFRTWAGSAGMLIKGGNAIWGNETWAPDDFSNSTDSHGTLYGFRLPSTYKATAGGESENEAHNHTSVPSHHVSSHHDVPSNLSASDAMSWLLHQTPATFQRMVMTNYSNGIEYDTARIQDNNQDPRTWANPLEAALPYAPSMKLISIYGVGKPTERSYYYMRGPYEATPKDQSPTLIDDPTSGSGSGSASGSGAEADSSVGVDVDSSSGSASVEAAAAAQCIPDDTGMCPSLSNSTHMPPLGFPTSRSHWIDTSVHSVDSTKSSPLIRSGCKMGEGDGTVSLVSLGAMSVYGWKHVPRYNPSSLKVTTHEVLHRPEAMDLRGGQTTGDHVDILGAWKVNEMILKVAAGRAEEVEENVVSDVEQYARAMDWFGNGFATEG